MYRAIFSIWNIFVYIKNRQIISGKIEFDDIFFEAKWQYYYECIVCNDFNTKFSTSSEMAEKYIVYSFEFVPYIFQLCFLSCFVANHVECCSVFNFLALRSCDTYSNTINDDILFLFYIVF